MKGLFELVEIRRKIMRLAKERYITIERCDWNGWGALFKVVWLHQVIVVVQLGCTCNV